ncbi:DNA polymerase III subunit delta' [Aureisphaera galaxeae]|uniref:DNA polymerase III subunit n=1 Tax=Aureisphaera galaxeae TaxID=1538023 RepID=UPI0023506C0F|nr:DNA polymerase III subunit delta' [Aureisphaera galaxeae]MDC8005089.1 DNA polymerase III subunit delta' [Aureisphaera galaxeae]
MDFSEIIGHTHIKNHLRTTVQQGRIAHAQLFHGPAGSGLLPLAIAYARELLCSTHEEGSQAYERCARNVHQFTHPDLHFVYPVNTNDTVKKNAVSSLFMEEWRNFLNENPYGSLFDWFQQLGIENKQGNISVLEAEDISKKLALKAYEGGFKIMIVWMADRMNTECSNKILKLVEEPPEKTVLLFLAEDSEQIINTIRSRCQLLQVPLLPESEIAKALVSKTNVSESEALRISRQAHGDYNKALHILSKDNEDLVFEEWFVAWVRSAFKSKGNKKAIQDLLQWSEKVAGKGRETQKNFLQYCIELFRQALLKNYGLDSLVYLETQDPKFSLEKFAPFVHQNNIYEILKGLEDALYHVERNGNAKIIFTDLSIQLTRLIHKKEVI